MGFRDGGDVVMAAKRRCRWRSKASLCAAGVLLGPAPRIPGALGRQRRPRCVALSVVVHALDWVLSRGALAPLKVGPYATSRGRSSGVEQGKRDLKMSTPVWTEGSKIAAKVPLGGRRAVRSLEVGL